MSTDTHAPDGTDTEPDRQAVYENVLATIRSNTGDSQPAGMRRGPLLSNRSQAGDTPDAVRTALAAAIENGDLIRWRDTEGRPRYAEPTPPALRAILTANGRPVTPDTVTAVIEAEIERDDARAAVIGAANDLVAQLRDGPDNDD